MASLEKATTKAEREIKNAYALGWSIFSRFEYEKDNQYCIVVYMTPQRKDE